MDTGDYPGRLRLSFIIFFFQEWDPDCCRGGCPDLSHRRLGITAENVGMVFLTFEVKKQSSEKPTADDF